MISYFQCSTVSMNLCNEHLNMISKENGLTPERGHFGKWNTFHCHHMQELQTFNNGPLFDTELIQNDTTVCLHSNESLLTEQWHGSKAGGAQLVRGMCLFPILPSFLLLFSYSFLLSWSSSQIQQAELGKFCKLPHEVQSRALAEKHFRLPAK